MTFKKIPLAIAAIGFAALIGGQSQANAASATTAPLASAIQLAPIAASLQPITWRRSFCARHPRHWRCRHVRVYQYCKRTRWRCANRWGWQTKRFYRCVRRQGC